MNSIAKSAMAAASMFLSSAIASSGGLSIVSGTPKRDFEFTYVAKLSSLPLPADAKLSRVWIALHQTDGYQKIDHLKIESLLPYSTRRDPEYGNEYLSVANS